jgi:hypothetical protein
LGSEERCVKTLVFSLSSTSESGHCNYLKGIDMRNGNIASSSTVRLAQAGAIAYIIWALLHFQATWSVYQLGLSMPEGMARGRVLQDAWNLFCFSVTALVVAIGLNWRNDILGWWLNLAVVSTVDLGFIFFVLIPGYIPLWPGLAGPLFWILGLVLSTMALRNKENSSTLAFGGR